MGKERAMEKMFDNEFNREQQQQNNNNNELVQQSQSAVKRSILSVESGDRIMEALELVDQEMKLEASFKPNANTVTTTRTENPMLLGMEPTLYILWILKSVKPAELEPSILVLPIHYVERLMHYIILLLRQRRGVEVCSRIAILLIKSHQNRVIATNTLATPIRELRKLIKARLNENKRLFAFNLIALKSIAKLHQEDKLQRSFIDGDDDGSGKIKDVWGNMGIGSDIAAAIENKHRRKRK